MKRSVLFIMTDLCGGGAEKALIELLKHFDYSRYKVSLCLLFNRGIYLEDIPKDVSVIALFKDEMDYYHRKAFRYYKKHGRSFFLSAYLKLRLKKEYDAIVSFLEGRPVLYHSFIFDRGKRNISWIHCDFLNYHVSYHSFFKASQEFECYKKMDSIILVSENSKNNFNKLYEMDTAKSCLYNVLDVAEIRSIADHLKVANEKFTIVAIGSLIDVKAFDRLIRVAGMLKKDGYDFCVQIIGTGYKEEEWTRLRDELQLQEVVSFLGFKKPVYPYLKQADLLVSTSLSEGLSYVICEAMILGVPVVATKTAGAIELLDNGRYGILAEQEDQSIYMCIKMLLDDENLRQEYKAKSKMRAEVFDVNRIMRKVYDLIEA